MQIELKVPLKTLFSWENIKKSFPTLLLIFLGFLCGAIVGAAYYETVANNFVIEYCQKVGIMNLPSNFTLNTTLFFN